MVKPPTLLINPKYRRIVAFLQLKKDNKNYKRLYRKIKKNNCALAKALSDEKQVNRSLVKECDAQRVEIQNLTLTLSRREEALNKIGVSGKEMLKGMRLITEHSAIILSSCQTSNHATLAPKPSRKSCVNKRLSVKSPARGVVQPMVSGHTITKPTINLSRVNMDHFRNVANLSAIQESPPTTTPNQSQRQSQSLGNTPQVPPPNRESASNAVRPQSIQDQASVNNSTRLSERRSRKRLRKSLDTNQVGNGNRSLASDLTKSPQVRLNVNEVSKYLQGSRSSNSVINQQSHAVDDASCEIPAVNMSSSSSANSDKESFSHMTNGCLSNGRKALTTLDETNLSFSMRKEEDSMTRRSNSASLNLALDESSLNRSSKKSVAQEENPLEGTSWMHRDSSFGKPRRRRKLIIDDSSSSDEGDNEENEDEDVAVNLRNNFVNCNNRRQQQNFVTRKRGSVIEEDDEFTMCLNKRTWPKSPDFDINQLKLPILVNPMSVMQQQTALGINAETEITSNLNGVTQNLALCQEQQRASSARDSVFGNMSLKLMPIDSDMDFTMNASKLPQTPLKKEKKQKRAEQVIEEKAKNNKGKPSKNKRQEKDPSTAKVVLQKLNDPELRIAVPSSMKTSLQDGSSYLENASAHATTGGSDSESSSCSSVVAHGRPKRKKAPTSFKEPSLNTKMRREK